MKKGKVKNSSKLNIKKISFGTALATGAIVTGVVLGEELKKHEQLEEKGKEDGIKGGGFKAALDTNNQQAQSAIEDKLTSAWSGIKTIADSGIAGKTWSDIHEPEVEPWITQLNGGTAIPHCTITKVEFFKHGQQVQADNDDKNVDAKISFKDDSQTNASLTFDKTILDLTFSKSPNQKTLDDLNLSATSVTVDSAVTNSFYNATLAADATNYAIASLPANANKTVSITTAPTTAQISGSQGSQGYTATVNLKITLGTATKDIPLTLSYSKFDKSAEITAIENLMSGFTLTGNKQVFNLNAPSGLPQLLSAASAFVTLQYSDDGGNTWKAWAAPSTPIAGVAGTSDKYKVKLEKNSTATDYVFNLASTTSYTPSTTGLKDAVDIKALKDSLASSFTLGGTSTAPTLSFSGTILAGVKLEVQSGSSGQFVTVSSNVTGVYPAGNIFDNSTAAGTLNSALNFKISAIDTTKTEIWDSGVSQSSPSTNPITGTFTPTLDSNFKKVFSVTTNISPTASGNTGSFTINEGSKPNNTKILYTVYDAQNAAVAGATDIDLTALTAWLSGKNLWDTAGNKWTYLEIKAHLVVDSADYSFVSTPQTVSVAGISSLPKLIDTTAAATTGTVSLADAKSNDIKSKITQGATVAGIDYEFTVDGTNWKPFSTFDPGNLWDQTKGSNGGWNYTTLKVRVAASTGFTLPSTATNGFEKELWSAAGTTPKVDKFVDVTSLKSKITGTNGISVSGSVDDKNLVWTIPTTITSDASTLNLDIKYVFSNATTAPATGWDDITNLTTKKAYPNAITSKSERHIFIQILPKTGFAVDTNASAFELTTSGLQSIPQQIDTSSVDLGQLITYSGDSDSLTFASTASTTSHYKVVYSTTANGTYQEYAAFAQANLTGKNIYNTTTGHWTIAGVWARLIHEDNTYTVSSNRQTKIWDSTQTTTKKVVDLSAFPTGGSVSGDTKHIAITDPASTPNVKFVYELFAKGSATPTTGDKIAIQNAIATGNLWDSTTGDWKYTEIKVKLASDASDTKLNTTTTNLEKTIWSSSSNPTAISKYLDTTAIAVGTNITFTPTDSKKIVINETYPISNPGYTYEYSVDGTNWSDKTVFAATILQNNLWDQNKGANGDWRYSSIFVRLKANAGFILDQAAVNGTTPTGAQVTKLVDFSQSADTAKITKYVDTKDLIDEIKKLNIIIWANGTDDANLVWNGVPGIKDLATKLNLNVEIALTDSTTVQTSPQGVNNGITWIALDNMATTGKQWSKEKVDKSAKRVWARITPKTSYTISPSQSTHGVTDTVYYDATSTSHADKLKYNHVILSTDFDMTASSLQSNLFDFTEPSRTEFEYEYYFDNDTTNIFSSKSELNKEIAAKDPNGKEGLWDSKNNNWRITTINVRLKAKSDYVLSGAVSPVKAIWKSSAPDKFNDKNPTTQGIKKWIDTDSATNNVWTALSTGVKPETTTSSLHDHVEWTNAIAKIKEITDRHIKVEFLYSNTDLSGSYTTTVTGWTTDISTINSISEEHAKRFIYARYSALDTNTSLTQTTNNGFVFVDLTTPSSIQAVKTDIDTSAAKFVIDQNLLAGDTHNLTGSTALNLANSGLSSYQSSAIKIVYTLNDFKDDTNSAIAKAIGYTGAMIKGELSEAELKDIFKGTAAGSANLWNLSGNWNAAIKAKIVFKTAADDAKFYIKNEQNVTFNLSNAVTANKLKKWIDTTSGRNKINGGANAIKATINNTNTHEKVQWNAAAITPSTIGYNVAIQEFEYFYGETAPTSGSSWSKTLPTIVNETHSKRNLWVRFVAKDGTFALSDNTALNITTASGIQNIKSNIDIENNYGTWDASKITFVGTTEAPTINASLAGTLPAGTGIEYQAKLYDAINNRWNDSGWKNEADFITLMKSPARIQIRTIKARLVNSDANKYVLTANKEGNANITGLSSYVDVSTEQGLVSPVAIMTSGTGKIEVWGILGTDTLSGIQVIIPQGLEATKLAKKGLVLQMSVNGGKFENFIAATKNLNADAPHGYKAATAGLYKLLKIDDLGTAAANHSRVSFRIIANVKDDFGSVTITDQDNWTSISNDIKVKTSEMVANNTPTVVTTDLSTLPKLVITIDQEISNQITLGGSSKALTIPGFESAEIDAYLKTLNKQVSYSNYIEVGFRVNDGTLPANTYLKRADFISWLAGNLTTANVFDATATSTATTGTATKSVTLAKPDWNKIDMDSFVGRWFSNDLGYRVSNSQDVKLATHTAPTTYAVNKWTDLTSYLTSLSTLSLSGDTANLTGSLKAIQDKLETDFGADSFKIQMSAKMNGTTVDWTAPLDFKDDTTFPEINFDYDLAFRIVPKLANMGFLASKLATPTSFDNDIIWAKTNSANILKYVHVVETDLQNVIFSGNSRNWTYSIAPQYVKSNKNGAMDANGQDALDIYAKIDGLTGFDTLQEINALKTAMANANINIFDGSWGREKFKVSYKAKAGYKIDSAIDGKINTNPTVTALNRYIDVTTLINNLKAQTYVKTKASNNGWWDSATNDYTDKKSWAGYVDNTNFDLNTITIPKAATGQNLLVKVEYLSGDYANATAATAATGWTSSIPTRLDDDKTKRHLWVRLVSDGTFYNGTTNEAPVLSDTTIYEVTKLSTTVSRIQEVLTKIDVSGVDLSKIEFDGTTRSFSESLNGAGVPSNTHVEYSITDFVNPTTSASASTTAIAALTKMGILNSGATQAAYTYYVNHYASLTIADLKAFIGMLPQDVEIFRSSIKARLVADTGYSLNQTDEASVRKAINVSKLYTFKDVTSLLNYIPFAAGGTGISLIGQKTSSTPELFVKVPDALATLLKATGVRFKLQYTTDGQLNASAQAGQPTTILAAAPKWNDATFSHFDPSNTNNAVGITASGIDNAFRINMKVINPANNESFIAFRFVPIANDQGTQIATTSNVAKDDTQGLIDYYNAAMTKYFKTTNGQASAQPDYLPVDTTKIPTVIKVDGIKIEDILASGNTKALTITGDDVKHGEIDRLNVNIVNGVNTNANLDDNLQLVYSIDNKDGSFINGQATNASSFWLTKDDMIAYLAGKLTVQNNQVVYTKANGQTEVVEAFTQQVLTARSITMTNGTKVLPNYMVLNTVANNQNSFFVKWYSMDADYNPHSNYVPSVDAPSALSYTPQTFKKWFDGDRYNTAISQLVIHGTTQDASTWHIDYSATTDTKELLDPASTATNLDAHELKLQYSYDGQTWQDSKLDWNTSWQNKNSRNVYLRVVPKAFTGTTALTGKVEADGIVIDYSTNTSNGTVLSTTVGQKTKTDEKVAGSQTEYQFKTYIDVDKSALAPLKIDGNSFQLSSTALDESAIDNNQDAFSQIEIQYLFNGGWYNKNELIAEMNRIKGLINSSTTAKSYVAPTDFNNSTVQARWRVLDPSKFVIKAELKASTNTTTSGVKADQHTSGATEIDKTTFKTFVNVWNIQNWNTNDFNMALANDPSLNTQASLQAALIKVSSRTDTSSNKIGYKWSANFLPPQSQKQPMIDEKFFTDNGLKIQWSRAENPAATLTSNDWNDWDKKGGSWSNIIDDKDMPVTAQAGATPPLWFRIVPIDNAKTTVSTIDNDGNGQNVLNPLRIDTSGITYTIQTDADALKDIIITGSTQNLTINEVQFLKAFNENGGAFGVHGVTEFVTDAKGNQILKPNVQQANDWLTGMGIRLRYKVIASRTKGAYTAGKEYEFDNSSDFLAAIATKNLNFIRENLWVKWDFSNPKFDASSNTQTNQGWIQYTSFNQKNLVNDVYTEDVYVLDLKSFDIQGNDIKIPAPTPAVQTDKYGHDAQKVLTTTNLDALGIIVEYNITADQNHPGQPDTNGWTATAPSTGLNSAKDYWVRFKAKDSNYNLVTTEFTNAAGGASQETRLFVDNVKLAIKFQDDKQSVIDEIKKASVTGSTFDFSFVNQLPKATPVNATNTSYPYGYIQYSIDNKYWADDIAGAMTMTANGVNDPYHNGVHMFNKDRGDKLYVRYVYSDASFANGKIGNTTPSPTSPLYVYTDKNGDVIDLKDLVATIDIDNLIQPIFTSATLKDLTNQASITANGLLNPSGSADFANVKWEDLANHGLFKPRFNPPSNQSEKDADFAYMWYDGTLTDPTTNGYIFNLSKNPFDPAIYAGAEADRTPTDLDALLPRHTHLEYRWTPDSSTPLSQWTSTPPKDITKNSNYEGFEVRLVADAGYSLNNNGLDYTVNPTYPDGSQVTTPSTIKSQEWTHKYKVVVELLTSNVQLKSANQADQAEYVGWDDTTNSTGRFMTTDPNGDHTPANNSSLLIKDIILKLYEGAAANAPLIDFANGDGKGYVLEWNVTNAGNNISWKDSRDHEYVGWHASVWDVNTDKEVLDQAPAAADNIPWYGAYPISLKNGDVVQVRLRARNGFIISKDTNSSDYEKGILNGATGTYELAGTKTSRWSHTITLAPVSGLTTRIDIPTDFNFFDTTHPIDFAGKQITVKQNMPTIKFDGSEGTGTLSISQPATNHYHYEVAILKPVMKTTSTTFVDPSQRPYDGYCLEDQATQNATGPTMIWSDSTGWVAHYKQILENKGAWVLPSAVNNLEVGDAVIVRLVANQGYGFEWEDASTSFVDTFYPKATTYDLFGTVFDPATVLRYKLGTAADQKFALPNELAPIPVRGLNVVPRYTVNSLDFVYSVDPSKKLNNGTSEIRLNNYPGVLDANGKAIGAGDKYVWKYTIHYNDPSKHDLVAIYDNKNPIKGLMNGDQVTFHAEAINSAYTLSPLYSNSPKTITVQGLQDPLEVKNVSRPNLKIEGYDGEGTIVEISTNDPSPDWENYKSTDPNFDPNNPLGNPINGTDSLIWEYQVVNSNPFDWTPERAAMEPWTRTRPTNLKFGEYIRMRVGAADPTKVALANSVDWVYSLNPNPIKGDLGSNKSGGKNYESWFKVEDLWVKPDQLDYKTELSGFIKKTFVSIQPTIASDEVGFVRLQVQIESGPAGKPTKTDWMFYGETEASAALKTLTNGDKINYRVVTVNGNGFRFNPNEPKVAGQDIKLSQQYTYYKWVNNVKEKNPTTLNVDILSKDTWTFDVKDLKIYINTDGVKFIPDVSSQQFAVESIIVDSQGIPLSPSHPINDGVASIKPIDIDPATASTIKDVIGGTTYLDPSSNTQKPLSEIVGVRYIVKQVDPYSGEQQQPFTVDKPGEVPKNLNINDEITVELYSKIDDYQISNSKSMTFIIKGLRINVTDPIPDPFLTFTGDSGKGSVVVNPQAPLRTKWVYAVTPEPTPGHKLPDIYELANPNDHSKHMIDPDATWIAANPGVYYWTSTPPVTLQNGDYVIAMLVTTVSGSTSLLTNNISRPGEIPMNTQWVRVSGLAQKIDLSRYQFKPIDEDNPWNSNIDNDYDAALDKYQSQNYAFKMQGHQEGETSLVINALLEAPANPTEDDLSKLLVDQYNRPLPASIASAVQWAFAVNNDPSASGDYNWSTTLPKALSNGQYVHVKLVAKPSLTNVQVYGYKPQVFKVEGLDASASVTNKVATLVSVVVGGFVALGAAVGTLMFIRKRKKKLHFND